MPSTWRYVLGVESVGNGDFTEDEWGVYEYYPGEDGGGWSANPVRPAGSTLEELRSDLGRMAEALDRFEYLELRVEPYGLYRRGRLQNEQTR